MNFGIPYMGSKSKIAAKIITLLPKAERFIDLFGGGFSISHAAILSKKYSQIYFNEIDSRIVDLIKKGINGDFNYNKFKPEFISRERFSKEKDKDAYISLIWSFGNNREDYLFSKEIENDKKSLHDAIIFDEFNDFAQKICGFNKWPIGFSDLTKRRLWIKSQVQKKFSSRFELQQLEQLQRLERLEQLQQLQQLQQLEQLQFFSYDYKDFPIIEGDVIYYCDPPYKGTAKYILAIDHNHFFNWADSLPYPCYISEYEIKDKRFHEVINLNKRQTLNGKGSGIKKVERIYVNKAGFEKYHLI
jgi:site-specific DNA-adenine methylase